jgi:hypothetical protein
MCPTALDFSYLTDGIALSFLCASGGPGVAA